MPLGGRCALSVLLSVTGLSIFLLCLTGLEIPSMRLIYTMLETRRDEPLVTQRHDTGVSFKFLSREQQ